ncbi:MAG: type IX secretion system protein PorQ [Bacteroidaceae bacterium]|nr:type IX secretion system protein PorQ [Bacteroidaceae bacterium]
MQVQAQESGSVFNFLSLPTSSHANALGGRNISLIDDDASLALQNPALLSSVSDKSINLNFLTYMQGSKMGSAMFVKTAGERGTWGASAQFLGYGKMTETMETGEVIGDMAALDMALSGMYSYELSTHWVGGVAGKFVYSKYGPYNSVGLGVDLALNYFDDTKDFSMSLVAANLGGQVKAFGDVHERMPVNLQWGFSKGVAHAPIRISMTLTDLTHWEKDYYYNPEGESSFGRILMNHINIGADLLVAKNMYVALGFNFRRANELKAAGASHGAGLTLGAGLNLKKFKLGVAYAKYHVSVPSLSLSLGYSL